MKTKEIRELSAEELASKLEELVSLRTKYHVNPDQKLKNSKPYRSSRKDIAKIKTVLNEKRKS